MLTAEGSTWLYLATLGAHSLHQSRAVTKKSARTREASSGPQNLTGSAHLSHDPLSMPNVLSHTVKAWRSLLVAKTAGKPLALGKCSVQHPSKENEMQGSTVRHKPKIPEVAWRIEQPRV